MRRPIFSVVLHVAHVFLTVFPGSREHLRDNLPVKCWKTFDCKMKKCFHGARKFARVISPVFVGFCFFF